MFCGELTLVLEPPTFYCLLLLTLTGKDAAQILSVVQPQRKDLGSRENHVGVYLNRDLTSTRMQSLLLRPSPFTFTRMILFCLCRLPEYL